MIMFRSSFDSFSSGESLTEWSMILAVYAWELPAGEEIVGRVNFPQASH